jgi:peptide-methionine (S)-S-oxide reductase
MNAFIITALFPLLLTVSCGQAGRHDSGIKQPAAGGESMTDQHRTKNTVSHDQADTAVFGAGCFWCVEAVFEQLDGVISVEAGYAGGHTQNPTYNDICTGETGHAEVARIVFDPAVISFDELLEMFWQSHDPTTLNRQGADVGTQYRSVIFHIGDEQREKAIASMRAAQSQFGSPIVTEISPLPEYYPAENYHQDYYRNNRNAPYCQVVIRPKLKKLGLE